MCAQVDVEATIPIAFADIETGRAGNASIGEIQVNRAEFAFRQPDEPLDLGGVGCVGAYTNSCVPLVRIDVFGNGGRSLSVQIGDDDPRTVACEPGRQCAADTAAPPVTIAVFRATFTREFLSAAG
ncbi:hypothetical protein I552_5155 [Mycobacterium xenopi 3993]|nr:hypothetical protein I552_5155 [Mycobacterium xenopi 3993]